MKRVTKSALAVVAGVLFSTAAHDQSPDVVAEYVGPMGATSFSALIISASDGYAHAMAFDVWGSPTITEVQLALELKSGSTGNVRVEIRDDADGIPGNLLGQVVSRPVSEMPDGLFPELVEFLWTSGQPQPSPGRYWIVCKLSSGSDAELLWQSEEWNPHASGDDTYSSSDSGSSWTQLRLVDLYHKVFGTRIHRNASVTSLTASPVSVAAQGVTTLEVTVKDATGELVRGAAPVTFSATGGTLGSSSATLTDGVASTTWTAPLSLDDQTITATFPDGWSYGGIGYQGPDSRDLVIGVVSQNSATATAVTLVPSDGQATTRSPVSVTATVTASSSPVSGGTVAFVCKSGTSTCASSAGSFSSSSVTVGSGGTATTTWTPGNQIGTYTMQASYSGHHAGTTEYGASSGSDDVTVSYTTVTTYTEVTVSPDHPLPGQQSYVTVDVRDSGLELVPGGTVQLGSVAGTFDQNPITLSDGRGSAKWTAASATGAQTITAGYLGHTASGNAYQTSSDQTTVQVVDDPDDPGGDFSVMVEAIANYSGDQALKNVEEDAELFEAAIEADGWWDVKPYLNSSARAKHLRKSSLLGEEYDYMDEHDMTYFSGHGHPDYITFSSPWYDKKLRHWQAADSWGTEDADWAVMFTCLALSNPGDWAGAMEGLHLIAGFHTVASDKKNFGEWFAKFMMKDGFADEPHTITQSWFLAGDMTHRSDKRQRVIAETLDCFRDHLWGQGYVSGYDSDDPTPTSTYFDSGVHDVPGTCSGTQTLVCEVDADCVEGSCSGTSSDGCHRPSDCDEGESCVGGEYCDGGPALLIASAGGDYGPVAVDELVQLEGSATSTPHETEGYLYYVWDTDPTQNSDSGNWDNVGGDGTRDDADLSGRRPQLSFSTPGFHQVRLMVRNDRWQTASNTALVEVTSARASAGSAPTATTENGELEIVDDFSSLPPESSMPLLEVVGTGTGYSNLTAIAQYYGIEGQAALDSLGNWTLTDGSRELLVNQHSGAVLYLDRERAYTSDATPVPLPSPNAAKSIAQGFLISNGIDCPNVDFPSASVSDFVVKSAVEGSRSYISRIPFRRLVDYRRTIDVAAQTYPFVGPGGKIRVMVDTSGDVGHLVKICRELVEGDPIPLLPAAEAIQKFHELGPAALVGGNPLPLCNRIEIDEVSLGYYEDDFGTPQQTIYPVYVLQLTCDDDQGSVQVETYLRADAPPVEVQISSPADGIQVNHGTAITFAGTALGGTPPLSYEWRSDVDGALGAGSSVQATLSVSWLEEEEQEHTVTLRATDQSGMSGEARVQVTIRSLGPPPVPDGGDVPGTQMTAGKLGDDVEIFWDTDSCGTAQEYNVYVGQIGDYDSVGSGLCAIGNDGTATLSLVGDDLWWIVTGAESDFVGSFGRDSLGSERTWTGWDTLCPQWKQDLSAACAIEALCGDGQDNDADGDTDCEDADCFGQAQCTTETECSDGQDNDADGAIDCADDECFGQAGCTSEQLCDDGQDNDADALVDCLDPDCDGIGSCEVGGELTCTDSLDNDADGAIDCADPDCFGQTDCTTETLCADGQDNDADGPTDCADPDCFGQTGCTIEQICDDGQDNDADLLVDCEDGDCFGPPGCPVEQVCWDLEDNDLDGLHDCDDPDCCVDPVCDGIGFCEWPFERTCNDQFDNDVDGWIDCQDPDCDGLEGCEWPFERSCADFFDNDGDGPIDCDDPDCFGHPPC